MQIPKIPGDTGKILSGLQKKRDEFLGQDLSGEDKTTLESINFNALSVSGKIFSSRQSFVIQVENILNKLQLDHTRVAILEKHTHKDSNIQTITRISNTSDLIDIGGGVIYNTSIYTLSMDNLLVKLTITEMLLFESLFTAGGKILSRDDLLDILGDEGERDFRTIDMHIKRLRKKLGVFGLSEHLKTHTGLGYSWMGNEIKLDTLSAEDKISIGDDIFLLPNLGGIYFKTELMPLTKSAIVILQKILSAPQRVFSREKIQAILGIDREQDLRGVDTHIKRLRQKLENIQTGLGKSIITLSGEGYYWDDSKSKSKGHIVSQTLMLQRDETLRQNIQSSVSEVHIATPTSFTISTINPMKTPALNQTLFGDYKDTFQELSHPKNLECISAFDSGNQVVPFQKLKEIFGNNWRDSMKTLASFLINTGYFFAYDETEEYVYLNYRRKRDKNSVNQENIEMKRKSNAIKALVEYILSSDFQQRYEDAGLNYTGIQEIDFSQGTIDGEKYSEIDFIEEVGLRIGEVLEIDEDENRDENRDEDIEEVNDERVVAGDHAEDGIGSEITPPVVSKNDIGFIGGKTPIESFVTPLVSVGTPEPLDESPIFNQLTLPQELSSGAFPGAKLRILLEANIGKVISFSQIMQVTSLESQDKVKKAIANLNLKVFSHNTSNKIFTLSETNTRTSSHLVLSDTNDFERIHVEFLNTKKSIIQSQSPVRRIGTRGPRPEVEDFTEESQLKTGAKIQNGMQFIYGEIFQTDTQTLRKLCETNKKWYNFERKSFRGVELSIDEFIMCVFGFSDEGFYYGDFDRDRNKVLSVKASLFRKIDSEGKKYDFTHNTEEALVKFTPREKDDTLKSEKFLRYLQQNSGRVIPKSELLREFTCMTDWQLISIRNKIPDKDAGCIIQIGDRNNFEGYFYGTEAKYIAYKEEQERIAEKRRRDGQVPVVVPKTTGISFSINHSQDEIHLITQNNSDVTLDLKNRSVNTIVLLEEEFALFLYLLKNRGVKMSLTQIGEYFGIDDTQVGNDFQMKFLGLKASMNNKLGKDNSLLHVQKDASNLFINQLTISEVKEYEAFGVKFSISSQFNTVDINGVRQQELGNGKIIEYLSEILGTKGYKKNFSVSYHRELIKTINQVFLDGKHRIHIYADTKSGIAKLEELRDLRQPVRVETGKVSEFEINILSQNHVFNIDHRAFGMTQQGTTLSFGLQRSGNGDVLFSEIEWIIFAYFLYHCGIEKDVKAIMDELCLFDDNTKQSTREFSEFLQSIKRNISEKMTKAGVNDKKYFITWRDEKFMIASHKKNDLTPSQNFQTPQTPESKVGKRILSNGVIIEYSEVDVTLKIKGREIQLGDNKEYNSYIFRFLRRNNERLKLSLGKNGKNPEYRINPINTYYSSLGLPFKINNSEEIYCTEK